MRKHCRNKKCPTVVSRGVFFLQLLLPALLLSLMITLTRSDKSTLAVVVVAAAAASPRTKDNNNNKNNNGHRLLRPLPSLEQLESQQQLPQKQPRIIGGTDAPERRYPYMVALLDKDGILVCGGTLIALDVVLTVSQCVNVVRAVIGRQQLEVEEEDGTASSSGEVLAIVQEVDHPFATGIFNYEYKLLKLERPTSVPTARPIAMLNADPSLPVVGISNGVTTMGYGTTTFTVANPVGPTSNTLKEVDITVLSNEECNQIGPPIVGDGAGEEEELEALGETYRGFISDDMICAYDVNPNQDFCLGDAGSPLILKGSSTTATAADQDVLVGLASWGFDCASSTFPGVYSRISDQLEWIRITTCQLTTTTTTTSSNSLPFSCVLPPISSDAQDVPTVSVTVSVTFDDFPDDIGWTLVDGTTWEVIEKVDGETAYQPPEDFQGQTVQQTFSLPEDRVYIFSIRDSFGTGLDPPGTYRIFVGAGNENGDDDGVVLVDGGDGNFGVVQTTSFQVPLASSVAETTTVPVPSPPTDSPTSSSPQQGNNPTPTIPPQPPSPNSSNNPPATPVPTPLPVSTLPPASNPAGELPMLSASAIPTFKPMLTPQPAITIVAIPDTTPPSSPGPTTEPPIQIPTPGPTRPPTPNPTPAPTPQPILDTTPLLPPDLTIETSPQTPTSGPTRPPTANPTPAPTPQPVPLSSPLPVTNDPMPLPTSLAASVTTSAPENPIPVPSPSPTTEPPPTQMPTPGSTRPPTPNPTSAPTVSLSCCTSASADTIRLDSTVDLVGCADRVCETIVCNVLGDEFCCLVEWDDNCATLAREQCNVCATPNPTVPPTPSPVTPTNSCCEAGTVTMTTTGNANVDRGCREMTCQARICQTDAFCCDIEWDGACASVAQRECDVCFTPNPTQSPTEEEPTPSPVVVVVPQPTQSPSNNNSCCVPSMFGEFQGCSDENCQDEICALNNDPYCCIVEWDVGCANRALEICDVCTNVNTPNVNTPPPTEPEIIIDTETPPPAMVNLPDLEPSLETSDEDLEPTIASRPTEVPTSVPSPSPSPVVPIVVLPTAVGTALPTGQTSSEVPSSSYVCHPFGMGISFMCLYLLLNAAM